ncbi:MAG: DNA primase DnaG [Desulfurococcaceae archaeon]
MAKYLIRARITVDGVVDKHDIIGAIFGQTEGLLGGEFDLKVLQDKGRVGRIQVNIRTQSNKTIGEILIPSNLDRVETALLAALTEIVDRVGPYDAEVKVVDIVDLRAERIRKIVERAVEILKVWGKEKTPDLKDIIKTIQDRLRTPEPTSYGPDELPAGPDIDKASTIIVVEGRADVINLLRYGYTNVIALGGARRVSETIKDLSQNRKIILLVDGDHGGDLVIKEVLRSMRVDYIARAPPNVEVEELTGKEIEEVLSKAQPVLEYLEQRAKQGDKESEILLQTQRKFHKIVEEKVEETLLIPLKVAELMKSLQGTLESVLFNSDWQEVKKIPVRDLVAEIEGLEPGKVYAVVMDGIITQRLLDIASTKAIKLIIGARVGKIQYKNPNLVVLTFNEIFTQ